MLIHSALILPTGDEICSGIVTDTDSPEVIRMLVKQYPSCEVTRRSPICDAEDMIVKALERASSASFDLIVLIGGSGGGHRHCATLSHDYTHSALESCLDDFESTQIYGKNGHLWCNLVCGMIGKSLVINLPGPYREASAAMAAFLTAIAEDPADLKQINKVMSTAVLNQYPKN